MASDLETMYRSFDVWKRVEGARLKRYRCFEVLPAGTFCVQSSDFYDAYQKQNNAALNTQFLELLSEMPPNVRGGEFKSIEEAIQHHDKLFDDEPKD